MLRPRRPQGGETRYAATVVRRDLPLGRETLALKTAAGGVIVTVFPGDPRGKPAQGNPAQEIYIYIYDISINVHLRNMQ